MEHRPSTPLFDPDAQAALHAELAAAASTPALRPLVLHPGPDLGPRFVGYWRQLSALPRRTRRSLQRRWKRSLAAIALLMALGQVPALAATIAVAPGTSPDINADGKCALIEAIVNANDDAATHGDCAPGSGADTIVLPKSSTQLLTAIHNSDRGPNGLPVITSAITIEGNGSTLTRDGQAPAFRILAVEGGNLNLNKATVSGGAAEGGGGGMYSYAGTVNVTNSTILGNSAAFGGGVAETFGNIALTNSTVSGNSAGISAGGVFTREGFVTVTNSTVSGNSARDGAGGVFNRGGIAGGIVSLTNSTVAGNSTSGIAGGMLTRGNGLILLTNSTVSGNSAGGDGGGVLNGVYGVLTLNRSVISGNTASDGPEVDNQTSDYSAGTVHADDFNLFGLNGEAGVSGFSPGATDIIPSGPLSSILGPLAANGGPTKTHALVAGSPAVDAVGSGCPPPATDQRGFVRPVDGDGDGGAKCDVGAFELAARPLPTCETAQPTRGCTVNGVANRLCRGTARGDQIFGTHRGDIIFGLDGNDGINGLGGNDLICGGKGKDILRGTEGRDRVFGGTGDDNLQGGSGNDQLSGEAGNDLLLGDRGDDALDGGVGTDKCNGDANGPTGDTAISCETVFGVP